MTFHLCSFSQGFETFQVLNHLFSRKGFNFLLPTQIGSLKRSMSYLMTFCSRPGTSSPRPARSGCPSSRGWSAARSSAPAAATLLLLHLCCRCHFSIISNCSKITSNLGDPSLLPWPPSRWRGRRAATRAASSDNAPCSGLMASLSHITQSNPSIVCCYRFRGKPNTNGLRDASRSWSHPS